MRKPRIHFEQVPLEIVKKIIEEKIPPEATTELGPNNRRQKAEKDHLGTKRKLSVSSPRTAQVELSK
jgi:hypothetical protein